MEILTDVAPLQYDFVYVPYSRTTKTNIGLAWVNFVDHSAAARAFQDLQLLSNFGSLRHVEVRSANIQGRAANLAYVLARFGLRVLRETSPPIVLQDGLQVSDLKAAMESIVDPGLLQEAREVVAVEQGGPSRRSCSGGYARRRTGMCWNPLQMQRPAASSAVSTTSETSSVLTPAHLQDESLKSQSHPISGVKVTLGAERLSFSL